MLCSTNRFRAALIALAVCGCASAQDDARWEQLKAQYRLVKIGFLGNNTAKDSTLLIVQKEGIFGVGIRGLANPTATYADGVLHSPGKTAALLSGANTTHWFQVNEQVYPLKFEVDLKADRVSVTIVSSDYAYKGRLHFQFNRGSLATATTAQVQDVIGQVLAFDSSKNSTTPAQTPSAPADAPANQPPVPTATTQFQPIQPPPPPQETRRVESGQTPEAVVGILGQPERIVDLGSKLIYVYRELKITFVDGKVADVQ
jgi:hypothetical protein